MSDPLDDYKKRTDELMASLEAGEMPKYSEETYRLAKEVLLQRKRDMLDPEPPEVWAERLMKSMYGEDDAEE